MNICNTFLLRIKLNWLIACQYSATIKTSFQSTQMYSYAFEIEANKTDSFPMTSSFLFHLTDGDFELEKSISLPNLPDVLLTNKRKFNSKFCNLKQSSRTQMLPLPLPLPLKPAPPGWWRQVKNFKG